MSLEKKIHEAKKLANTVPESEFIRHEDISIRRLTVKISDLSTYLVSQEVKNMVDKVIEYNWQVGSGDFPSVLMARWIELVEVLDMLISAIEERTVRPADRLESKEQMPTNSSKIFVVHGRNENARKAMFEFLRSIHLDPIEWSEALNATKRGTPSIEEILDRAFGIAQAIVVLLTPDDMTCLREEY